MPKILKIAYDIGIIISCFICVMKKLKLREFKEVPKFAQVGGLNSKAVGFPSAYNQL